MSASRTFKLTVAYDGTEFSGWQVQPGRATIQGCLQDALARLVGKGRSSDPIHVIGSGRTDTGVHAIAQVASCRLPSWNASAGSLATAINTKLPDSILVTDSIDAPDNFHAIRDAVKKRYRYQIQNGGNRNVLDHRFWHRVGQHVDVNSIRSAASRFIGTHDFASFQSSGADRKTTVRTIHDCDVVELPDGDWGEPRFAIEVEANGFLYNMVRAIVGSLLEVGRGRQSGQWITEVLKGCDRSQAGPTAPAKGLFLKHVTYEAFDSCWTRS